jgi:hypothetical protein
MMAIDVLRAHAHPIPAAAVAQAMGVPIEEAYVELVAAESAGLARVVVNFKAREVVSREWVATPQFKMRA